MLLRPTSRGKGLSMRTPVAKGEVMGQGGVGSRLWGDEWAVRRGSWHLQYSLCVRRKERHRVVKRAEIVLLESIESLG